MKVLNKLYTKLSNEYNKNNIQKYCSFQSFLEFKYNECKNSAKKSLIHDVIEYAKTDF